jgi:hypothetical protein
MGTDILGRAKMSEDSNQRATAARTMSSKSQLGGGANSRNDVFLRFLFLTGGLVRR